LSLNFLRPFLKQLSSHATGLDISEVDFSAASDSQAHIDQQTFRELFELVLHEVNQPKQRSLNLHFSEVELSRSDLSQ
jgi:hypothetical protein